MIRYTLDHGYRRESPVFFPLIHVGIGKVKRSKKLFERNSAWFKRSEPHHESFTTVIELHTVTLSLVFTLNEILDNPPQRCLSGNNDVSGKGVFQLEYADFGTSMSSTKTAPINSAVWGFIMAETEDFFDRLVSLRLPGETKKEFCRRAGIGLRTLYHWEDRKHTPNIKDVALLAFRLGVCRSWLAFGITIEQKKP